MGKIKIILIFILVAAAFTAGVYFRDDALRLYNDLGKKIQEFKATDIGNIISKVGQQILAPSPLNIGGSENQVVLVKSKIIEQTNFQRALNQSEPLKPLKENALLDAAALAKANDMFKNQYFEHTSPAGVDPGKLVQSFGYDYIVEGENLILGNFSSEKEVVQDWMNSPGHRANILNNRYTEIGVAIIKGTYKGETAWIGVQEFGLPLSSCTSPSDNLKNQIDTNKAQLDLVSVQISEKRSQIDSVNPRSAAYGQMADDYNQLVAQYNALAEATKSLIAQYNNQVNIFNACVQEN